MRRFRLKIILLAVLLFCALLTAWILWTETNPELERELRIATQDQLEEWFPEAMSLPPELVGFQPAPAAAAGMVPDVILIHGLDEPGGIWDETLAELAAVGLVAWEFRYPNDQAIDHSADLLAHYWPMLTDASPVILVGHSMGGLVIRDFVTRWRHPVGRAAEVAGPEVLGAILVATPNRGSAWARLRAWLEVREWISNIPEGRLSPFSGLRHGTGAAKIDLRPDSQFLTDLNARRWPEEVRLSLIGGRLGEPATAMLEGLDQLADELDVVDLRARVEAWWAETGEDVGDGAVPVTSLQFDGAPEPILLPASHRGLLVSLPLSEDPPPAIALILEIIAEWRRDE